MELCFSYCTIKQMHGIEKLSNVCSLRLWHSIYCKVWQNLTIPLQEASEYLFIARSDLKSNLKESWILSNIFPIDFSLIEFHHNFKTSINAVSKFHLYVDMNVKL